MLGKGRSVATANVLIVGESNVGKTELVRAMLGQPFDETYFPTVYDTHLTTIGDEGEQVQLAIWDTAGHEDFDQLREITAYRTATPFNAIFICYSVDDRHSFEQVTNRWFPELKQRTAFPNVPVTALVGLKSDLRFQNETSSTTSVGTEEGKLFCDQNKLTSFFECSAKTGVGVSEVFEKLVDALTTSRRRNSREFVKRQLSDAFSKFRRSFETGNQHQLAQEDPQEEMTKLKVVLIGDAQSGKSSLAKAIGTSIVVQQASSDISKRLDLAVGVLPSGSSTEPDTLRQLPMMLSFYCGQDTDVIILCVAIDQPASLKRVTSYWLPDIYGRGMTRILPMILVGTKKDLRSQESSQPNLIRISEAKRVAKLIGAADYVECSSNTGDGLEGVREATAQIFTSKLLNKVTPHLSKKASVKAAKSFHKEQRRSLTVALSSPSSSSEPSQQSRQVKIVVVGDVHCGKLSLIKSFLDGEFLSWTKESSPGDDDQGKPYFEHYSATLKLPNAGGLSCDDSPMMADFELEIWKTSGADRCEPGDVCYSDLLRAHSYPDADVILLCVAVDEPGSIERLSSHWSPEIKFYCSNVPVVLVGTKSDLVKDEATLARLSGSNMKPVAPEDGERVAKEIGAAVYVECSAKTSQQSVRHVFETAARIFLNSPVTSQRNYRWKRLTKSHQFQKHLCKTM